MGHSRSGRRGKSKHSPAIHPAPSILTTRPHDRRSDLVAQPSNTIESLSPSQIPLPETTLTPDILPLVITQLDKKLDLDTLLICQRVSQAGWETATRKIYRSITVRDWSKLFWMPDGSGSRLETLKGFSSRNRPPKWTRSARGSFRRRLVAFSIVETMHIMSPDQNAITLFYRMIHEALRVFSTSTGWPIWTPPHALPKEQWIIFPSLQQVQLDPDALLPRTHLWNDDGLTADSPDSITDLILETRRIRSKITVPHMSLRPKLVCVHLPSPPDSTEVDDIQACSDIGAMLLAYTDHPGAEIYVHNMWGRVGVSLSISSAKHYHLLYPMLSDTSGYVSVLPVIVARIRVYGTLLHIAEATQQRRVKDDGHQSGVDHVQTFRWTISGEARFPKQDVSRPYIDAVAQGAITAASHMGTSEAGLMKTDSEMDTGTERLRFRYPGYEEVCPVCGGSE